MTAEVGGASRRDDLTPEFRRMIGLDPPLPADKNAPARSGNSGEGSENQMGAGLSSEVTNLARLTPSESRLWNDGYQWGRTHGLEDGFKQGYQKCDEEISTLQREAARIVHHMAGIEPRDPDVDRANRERIDNYFTKGDAA